jgi:hypothetical protein
MPRPRKNRVSEYASLLGEELRRQLTKEIALAVRETERPWRQAVEGLRQEVVRLRRELAELGRRRNGRKQALGRWVPGGPGRPPKDAAQRVAAFTARRGRRR